MLHGLGALDDDGGPGLPPRDQLVLTTRVFVSNSNQQKQAQLIHVNTMLIILELDFCFEKNHKSLYSVAKKTINIYSNYFGLASGFFRYQIFD